MVRISIPDEQAHDPYGYASAHHATSIMAAAAHFSHTVYRDSRLSLREFEGARMRTALINGCQICRDFRMARDGAAMFTVPGEPAPKTDAANGPAPDEAFYAAVAEWRTSPVFSDRERLTIEFAERFAEEPQVLARDEPFWSRMKAAFSDSEVVDLAHCVAAWVGLGRVAHVLGFDGVCLVPQS